MANAQILVVEDEDNVVKLIQRILGKLGYTIHAIVDSGENAVKAAEELHPDLVFMDIELKGMMDGVEAAEQIHTQFNIPVVYLTAHASDDILQRAKVTEPFGYIVKPFNERDIESAIQLALYKHSMETQLKKTKQWLAAVIKNMGDAMIALDQDRIIKSFNLAAEQLFDYKSSESLGKPFRLLFPSKESETAVIQRAQNVGKYVAELRMRRKDASLFPAKLHVSTIWEATEQPSTYVVVVRDLTVEKEIETLRGTLTHTKEYLKVVMKQLDKTISPI